MHTSGQIISDQKRIAKSKKVIAQLAVQRGDVLYFNILNENGTIKYLVRTRREPAIDDYCTCGDFIHRNTDNYMNENGHALQCKHILKCKRMLGLQQELYLRHMESVKTHTEALSK